MPKLASARLDIQVEGMTLAIMEALTVREEELRAIVDDEVRMFMENGAADAAIRHRVRTMMTKITEDAVDSALRSLTKWDLDVRKMIAEALKE